ncbi:unnamed protein product [Moneuplotes crassus]|uniref:Uncharacterized protein n=1 Tax=Euplotes crassus TaxID=5936 RepID=A0AAD1XJM2_EUPCR|nr:unnamed protein product [Moneuplotes crassus]
MSKFTKRNSVHNHKNYPLKVRLHSRHARNSVDFVRKRRNPFKNLVIKDGNDLFNSETISHYIKNSFDSKTNYLRLKIANLVEKQKEIQLFKEKYFSKATELQNDEFSQEHKSHEISLKDDIERLKKVLETHCTNPLKQIQDKGQYGETRDCFHPKFKLRSLGPSYSNLSMNNKVKLIDCFLKETYKPQQESIYENDQISDYSDTNSMQKFSTPVSLSKDVTLTVDDSYTESSTSLHRGLKQRISLLPKGNIRKNKTYLDCRLKQNNIRKSDSLKVLKIKSGALFKKKSPVRLTDVDHFRILGKIKQFRKKKGF